MHIAYIGVSTGTSLHRAQALRRIGHHVTIINPLAGLPHSKWVDRWVHHSGAICSSVVFDKWIIKEVRRLNPNLIWVAQCEYLGGSLIQKLHQLCSGPVVNYVTDDPFGGRDGLRFRNLFSALKYYDLLTVVRSSNVAEATNAGAQRVLRIFMSADEVAHRPRSLSDEDYRRFASEVSFVGTWMPERGPFLTKLLRFGVPLSIWGDRWRKAPEWKVLKPVFRGPALNDDDSYAKAIQASKINIGLLSKGNRDLHTQRSMEIPALGGLLCAERTSEHQALYRENEEAVFWSTAEECAAHCKALLSHPELRLAISHAGRARMLRSGNYNEPVLAKIIETAFALKRTRHA